ncbi:MAG: hypothetical protein WC518_03435 [Patescibacteria group bacterium]
MNLRIVARSLQKWRKLFLLETVLWVVALLLVGLIWLKLDCDKVLRFTFSVVVVGLGASFISPIAGSLRDLVQGRTAKRKQPNFRERRNENGHRH